MSGQISEKSETVQVELTKPHKGLTCHTLSSSSYNQYNSCYSAQAALPQSHSLPPSAYHYAGESGA